MANLFVSYRTEDTGSVAPLVMQWLAAEYGPDAIGHDVANGLTGDDYRRNLDPSLRHCSAVVVLVGQAFARPANEMSSPPLFQPSDRVRIELETALALSLPVLPLLIDDTPALRVENLPESLLPLAAAASLPLHSRTPLFENEIRQVYVRLDHWMRPPQPFQYFPETPATSAAPIQPAAVMYTGQAGHYDQTLPSALTNATPSNPYYAAQPGSQPPKGVSRRAAIGGLLGLGVVLGARACSGWPASIPAIPPTPTRRGPPAERTRTRRRPAAGQMVRLGRSLPCSVGTRIMLTRSPGRQTDDRSLRAHGTIPFESGTRRQGRSGSSLPATPTM